MKNYVKGVDDQGKPTDSKDQIKIGGEIYQGWKDITEKVLVQEMYMGRI